MRGRKPAPTAAKIAKGETRPSRVNYEEPDVPPPDSMQPPKGLTEAGLRLWRDYMEPMTIAGQLRKTDVPAFLEHCKTASEIETWERELRKKDLDRPTKLSIQRTLNQLRSLSLRQAAELGMTCVSRSRVKSVVKAPVEKPQHSRFFGDLRGIRGGRA